MISESYVRLYKDEGPRHTGGGIVHSIEYLYDTSRGPDQKQIIGLKAETENMTPEGSFISVTNYFIGHDRFITVECTFLKLLKNQIQIDTEKLTVTR